MLITKKYIEICILIRAHLSLMNGFFSPFLCTGKFTDSYFLFLCRCLVCLPEMKWMRSYKN